MRHRGQSNSIGMHLLSADLLQEKKIPETISKIVNFIMAGYFK